MIQKSCKNALKVFTLKEHFLAFRCCLIKILCFFFLMTIVTFQFSWDIFYFLSKPLSNLAYSYGNSHFIYTKLTEGFMTELKISFISSFFFCSPFIVYQLYKFLEPGLYQDEKKIIIPYLFLSPLLFLLGVLLVYFVVMPITWKFFMSFQNIKPQNDGMSIILEARISEYIDLIIELFMGFGLAFQLPILLLILTKLQIINYEQLRKFRRYAVVLIFILAAILTPPDVISQIILALPLVLLYEISILLCKRIKHA